MFRNYSRSSSLLLSSHHHHHHKTKSFVPQPPAQIPVEHLLGKGYRVQVPHSMMWGDADSNQHLNSVMYFKYFEHIRIIYFSHVGIKACPKTNPAPIMSKLDCKFRIPIDYPEQLVLAAKITHLERDKFIMSHAVYSTTHQKIAAVGDGVIVAYDYSNKKKTVFPEAWLRFIEDFDSIKIGEHQKK